MEHSRKQKLLMIIALVIGIASLSIGFAAFSTTLNISSSASVSPSSDTFKVKFSTNKDSLVVGSVTPSFKMGNITTTDGIIDNSTNPTIKGLSATFTSPGQLVEYAVYARNEGEYTAYLNNINFVGEKVCTAESGTTDSLVQAACDYIDITVSVGDTIYSETTPISGHALASGQGELIYFYIEYRNGPSVDGPMSITFPDVALVYSSIDDPTIRPTVSKVVKLESGDLKTPGSIISIGNEQFYVFGQEGGNVKLLSMYNLLVGNSVDEDWNVTPLSNPTGIQDEDARGYVAGEFPFIGTTAFSSDSQKGTNYSDYNGSIVEGYVNNYASYLEGLGANIEEARLITKEELETLGCSSDAFTCRGVPEFVYKTSYWSGSDYDTSFVWYVYSNTPFGGGNYNYVSAFGVRPVILISTSEF